MEIRCRCPPEKSAGRRCRAAVGSPASWMIFSALPQGGIAECSGKNLEHRHTGIQGAGGILKDVLHLLTVPPPLVLVQLVELEGRGL